jgi:hypothetical protein
MTERYHPSPEPDLSRCQPDLFAGLEQEVGQLQDSERLPMAGGAPQKIYQGYSEDDGSAIGPSAVFVQTEDGQLSRLKHEQRHSPDGLSWGYSGSGPADLARSLLADHLGFIPEPAIYQAFKRQHVARWDQGKPWQITTEEIETFLTEPEIQERLQVQWEDAALRWQMEEVERQEREQAAGHLASPSEEELRRLSELDPESINRQPHEPLLSEICPQCGAPDPLYCTCRS